MNAVLLSSLVSLLASAQGTADLHFDPGRFRREFEIACDAQELDRVKVLVVANPTLFVDLFQSYARVWIDVQGDPGSNELLVLERARVLAETVDSALDAPGLLEQWQALEQFDEQARQEWQEASARYQQEPADPDRATLTSLLQAARQFEKVGDAVEAARAWFAAAEVQRHRGQFPAALDCHQRALALRESLGNPQDIALSHSNLGNCYQDLGQIEKAVDQHQRALALSERLGIPGDIAGSLNNLGLCYEDLGQVDKAIDYHQRALALWEPLGNPQAIVLSLNNLGSCYQELGQVDKAIENYQRVLAFRKPPGNSREMAQDLNNLGLCYTELGQFEKAIDHFQRALALWETAGSPQLIANRLENLGTCYQDLGQTEKAIDHHRRALVLQETLGNPQLIANSLNNLGNCYQDLGQVQAAIDCHERALATRGTLGNPRLIASSLNNLGNCYQVLGQIEKAVDYYQRALALLETLGNPHDIAVSLLNLGDCHEKLGEPEKAIGFLSGAFEALASVSLRSFSARDQSQFRSEYRRWHLQALDAALRLPPASPALADAFWITESLRSRSMLEELTAEADDVLMDADPSLQSRRQVLLSALETGRLRLEEASGTPGSDPGALQEQLAALEQELREVTGKLRRSSPGLMELAMPEAAHVDEIRRHVLGPKQGLLQFVLAEERSYLWLLTSEELRLCALPGEAELGELYQELSRALTPDASSNASFVAPARLLHEALLGPIAGSLESLDELFIVADGFLGYLPFEVLLTEAPEETDTPDLAALHYLLRGKTISYAPSASFLVFHAKEGARPAGWKKDALLLGDPISATERVDASATAPPPGFPARFFPRLPRTREEVTGIASELIEEDEAGQIFLALRDLEQEKRRSGSVSGSRFDLYVGEEVNETRLKSDLRGYRIIHLATHGYFDAEHPWFSGLVLSSTPGAEEGADFLNLLELGTLKLDAQLVFLSACETSTGELIRSEGVQSTARSFLIAGARSVIATQWKVRDDVASTVARTFYRKLFDGLPPAAALRLAKLAILDDTERGAVLAGVEGETNAPSHPHAHPSFWAPFVIFGGLDH